MPAHISLSPHLSSAELEQRYRAAKEPNERSWWQMLWLLELTKQRGLQWPLTWEMPIL
jgi:hypothetical protein